MDQPKDKQGIPRRDFLTYGSVGMATALWLGLGAAKAQAARVHAVAGPDSPAIGYCPPGLDLQAIRDACALSSGESGFVPAGGARLQVAGRMPDAGGDPGLQSMAFYLHYAVGGVDEPLKHLLWLYRGGSPAHISPGAGSTVPVKANGGVDFTLEVESLSGARRVFSSRLSVGEEAGLAKLRRGTYFLAPPGQASWKNLQWGTREGRIQRLTERSALARRARPVAFPYLVISVDYRRPALAAGV